MEQPASRAIVYRFDHFRLDKLGHQLQRQDPNGKVAPVLLGARALDVLLALVERSGEIVPKAQIMDTVWSGLAVEEANLTVQISALRRALDRGRRGPSLIRTVRGHGYLLAATVTSVGFSPNVPSPTEQPVGMQVRPYLLRSQHPMVGSPPELPAIAESDEGFLVPRAPERRPVTVVACEILGLAVLSAGLNLEHLRDVTTACHLCCKEVVERHRGYIANYGTDNVLAYFGYPQADEHDVERAVSAALALVEAMPKLTAAAGTPLHVRVGIATGLVVAGDPHGVDATQTVTVVGEAPNLAVRLQNLAQPDAVLVSETTHSHLGRLFECRDLGRVELNGLPMAVPAWLVLGKGMLESRFEALHGNTMMPLIGREEELELVLRRWRQAADGEGRIVLLTGEPGIGKSRLMAELEARLATDRHATLRYFCSPLHQGSPLHPVIARWEQDTGFSRGDTAEQRLRKLQSVLAPDNLSSAEMALLAGMLGVPSGERYPQPDLSPQRRKERTFAVLHRRLAFLAQRQPVLMLLEDAQWADHSSLELFDTLVSQITKLPILLVISFRPEFVSSWISRAGVSLITLTRLDQRHSEELVTKVAAAHVLTQALLKRIIVQADGVPMFIEELTKAILETAPNGSSLPLAVPSTLQASLVARLDRLPTGRQVAQIGAVIGREFSYDLLVAAVELSEAQLTKGLDELVAAGLVSRRGLPPDAGYTFTHALVQEVAYESLLTARRQQIHRQIAETVRDQLPERANAEPEIVAHHFTQANLSALAVEWWGKAGELAMRRPAYGEAIEHLGRALQMADQLGEGSDQRRSRLRLQITYGNALRVARGFGVSETQGAFAVASELAGAVEDASERFPAYYGLWSGSFLRGDLTPMQAMATAFQRDVESRPSSPEAAIARRISGMTRWFEGNFLEAQRDLEQALAVYDAVRDRELVFRFGQDLASPAMTYLALALWPLGVVDRAGSLLAKSVIHAVETRHIPTIAYAYGHAATFEMMRRDRPRSAPNVEALLGIAQEHGMPVWKAAGTFCEGWLRWGKLGCEADLAEMHEGMALMRLQQQGVFMPMFMTRLAETEAEAGDPDAALDTLDMQLETIERTGQRWCLSEVHRARGETMLKCWPIDSVAAEDAFVHAIEIARGQSAKLFELQAAVSLARLWRDQGKRAEARDLLAPIYNWFIEGLDAPDLKDANALLNELT